MKENENNLQNKYMEFQLLNQQITQLQQQIMNLGAQVMELNNLKDSLTDIKKFKKGTDSLVPLGNAVFTKVELKETDEVIVGVGSNILVKKNVPEAQKFIDVKIKEIETLMEQLQKEMEKVALRIDELQSDLVKATEKQ